MKAIKTASIHQFLEKQEDIKKFIQAKVNIEIVETCRVEMKKDGITWDELMEASLRAYLAEKGIKL